MDERRVPQDPDSIPLDDEAVPEHLEADRRRTTTQTHELIDLTLLEPRADAVMLPEPGEQLEH